MSNKISFVNNKGGSGKTTTVVNVAGVIHQLYPSQKILIVDVDAQGNASRAFGLDNEKDVDNDYTMYQVFLENLNPKKAVIKNVGDNQNIDLIPSSLDLNFLEFDEIKMINQNHTFRNTFDFTEFYFDNLKHKFDELDKLYDFILFDTPPELKSVTSSVLAISNSVIIPYEPDAFSIDGVRNMVERIQEIQEQFNPDLKIAGFLTTKYNQRSVPDREYVDVIHTYAKALDFPIINTKIPYSVRYRHANGYMPVTLMIKNLQSIYNDRNKAIKAYFDLVNELIKQKVITINQTR